MKTHTTNYINTFILTADDCPSPFGEIPPVKKDKRTVANMQFDILSKNPYRYTSDDVLFRVFADKNELTKSELKKSREEFFSKGQPCFRASPLTKRYGWGVHCNEHGKMAIYGCETGEYQKYAGDKNLTIIKAMKAAR
ncbi:MAG: DUF6157 family protein [Agriterribacter sp.]